jgi:hypothetical protein
LIADCRLAIEYRALRQPAAGQICHAALLSRPLINTGLQGVVYAPVGTSRFNPDIFRFAASL